MEIDFKYVVVGWIVICLIVMAAILATTDDVVIMSVVLVLLVLTNIMLVWVDLVTLSKYERMYKLMKDFLLSHKDTSLDDAISGFAAYHIKDISEGMLEKLPAWIDVTKTE